MNQPRMAGRWVFSASPISSCVKDLTPRLLDAAHVRVVTGGHVAQPLAEIAVHAYKDNVAGLDAVRRVASIAALPVPLTGMVNRCRFAIRTGAALGFRS